ncbi:MAG: BrnT family toxin [Thiomicrorhabdus sp.]|nr:BrnT family toxin [Thiomicrorhabdus sp.]
MSKECFDWDPVKDRANQAKHGLSFTQAQYAFADPNRVIAKDLTHSDDEDRYYCFGRVEEGIATARFTYRDKTIRIFWCWLLAKR